jgi:hypothetical protein
MVKTAYLKEKLKALGLLIEKPFVRVSHFA